MAELRVPVGKESPPLGMPAVGFAPSRRGFPLPPSEVRVPAAASCLPHGLEGHALTGVPGPWDSPEDYDREFFRRSFAACVITDDDGRVLLLHTTYGDKKWELPGGVLERGEAPWEAARREAREEIDIELGDLTLTGVYFLAHRDGFGFIFRTSGYAGTIQPDGVEIDDARFFSPGEFPSPMSSFAHERILDALAAGAGPALRVQHRRERAVRQPLP